MTSLPGGQDREKVIAALTRLADLGPLVGYTNSC
jgi:hypothetical protein